MDPSCTVQSTPSRSAALNIAAERAHLIRVYSICARMVVWGLWWVGQAYLNAPILGGPHLVFADISIVNLDRTNWTGKWAD